MYMYISELSNKNDHCAVVIIYTIPIGDNNKIGIKVSSITQLILSIQYTLVNYCITKYDKNPKAVPCP